MVALYAFGSRAAEVVQRLCGNDAPSEAPDSDLDLGVQPGPGQRLSGRARVDLTLELEALLGVDSGRVDLVVLPEAPPFLALEVVRGELLACTDPDEQARFELYVLRRAGDLVGFERERRRAVLEEGAS